MHFDAQKKPILQLPPAAVPKRRRSGRDAYLEHRLEILGEAKELGLSGATDFEACEELGISQRTLNKWKTRYPEFRDALQLGKDIADGKVVASLYHKARGYSFRSEKIFQHEGAIIRAETIEHVPPSDTAIIFWLKNRQKEQWRDRFDTNVSGEVNHVHTLDARQAAIGILATLRMALEQAAQPQIEGELSDVDAAD